MRTEALQHSKRGADCADDKKTLCADTVGTLTSIRPLRPVRCLLRSLLTARQATTRGALPRKASLQLMQVIPAPWGANGRRTGVLNFGRLRACCRNRHFQAPPLTPSANPPECWSGRVTRCHHSQSAYNLCLSARCRACGLAKGYVKADGANEACARANDAKQRPAHRCSRSGATAGVSHMMCGATRGAMKRRGALRRDFRPLPVDAPGRCALINESTAVGRQSCSRDVHVLTDVDGLSYGAKRGAIPASRLGLCGTTSARSPLVYRA